MRKQLEYYWKFMEEHNPKISVGTIDDVAFCKYLEWSDETETHTCSLNHESCEARCMDMFLIFCLDREIVDKICVRWSDIQ